MQIPGRHHWHRELHDLGGLKAYSEVKPAPRALADFTQCQDEDEQHESGKVAPRRPAAQEIRR